jgi:hypothetical protein
MSPELILLIKILTDTIVTASLTLSKIHHMSREQTIKEIEDAEANTIKLLNQLKQTRKGGDINGKD